MLDWFNAHKTKITGLVIVVGGAVQLYGAQLQMLMSQVAFARLTVVAGVIVMVLGFLNNPKS